jgi:hypothetical protein
VAGGGQKGGGCGDFALVVGVALGVALDVALCAALCVVSVVVREIELVLMVVDCPVE